MTRQCCGDLHKDLELPVGPLVLPAEERGGPWCPGLKFQLLAGSALPVPSCWVSLDFMTLGPLDLGHIVP